MRRSKFVFLIMAVLYLLIALFIKQDFLIVNGNALFALALSAMLISIGDSIEKISLYLQLKNDLNAALTVTHEFLNKKINKGIIPSTVVNVRNLDEYIKRMISSGYIFCHPYDYSNSMRTMKFSICSMVFFVVGISAFIGVPFIRVELGNSLPTSVITIFAFAAMSFNLFLDEMIGELRFQHDNLINDKHLIIQSVYTDFQYYYQLHMIYRNDLDAIKIEEEKKSEWLNKQGVHLSNDAGKSATNHDKI